ncbi:hypothetical protein NL676_008996 [Syzygium grande]|nr:hypothetical protein NL676_008996 [Syzygium grande]
MAGSRKSLLATVFTVILILLWTATRPSTARELRPADHGLEYQSSPPSGVDPSPDMTSFFGTSSSALPPPLPSSSSSPYAPATDTAMTGPMESSGSWRPHHSSGGGGRDRVRDVLVVASIACGAVGVVLMGASAFLFLFRFKRERARPEPQSTSQQEK